MQVMDPGCCSWGVRVGGVMEGAAACQPCFPIGQLVAGLGERFKASIAS